MVHPGVTVARGPAWGRSEGRANANATLTRRPSSAEVTVTNRQARLRRTAAVAATVAAWRPLGSSTRLPGFRGFGVSQIVRYLEVRQHVSTANALLFVFTLLRLAAANASTATPPVSDAER
jgi:hypothetical protein